MLTNLPLLLFIVPVAVLFLSLFVFLPKLIQRAMKADADAAIEAFGKNEQVKKMFWTLFICDGGAGLGSGCGPGDRPGGCGDYYGGGVRISPGTSHLR